MSPHVEDMTDKQRRWWFAHLDSHGPSNKRRNKSSVHPLIEKQRGEDYPKRPTIDPKAVDRYAAEALKYLSGDAAILVEEIKRVFGTLSTPQSSDDIVRPFHGDVGQNVRFIAASDADETDDPQKWAEKHPWEALALLIGSLFGSVPKTLTKQQVDWARKHGLEANSAGTRRLLDNLDTPVTEYIAKFRQGRVRTKIPSELLQPGVTVRQAIERGGRSVKKLLVDQRFAK